MRCDSLFYFNRRFCNRCLHFPTADPSISKMRVTFNEEEEEKNEEYHCVNVVDNFFVFTLPICNVLDTMN